MRVIILNGSPKAHGNTATALHEVERTLQKQGIETDWMHVGQLQIHGCIACNKCWKAGICAFNDIVNEISEKMREADGLLVGSPVYFASPNGTLLSLLDRLFYSNLHTDWSMKATARTEHGVHDEVHPSRSPAVRLAEDSGRVNRNPLYQIIYDL